MNSEKTYTVEQRGMSQRDYTLRELVWLWRSGMIPYDATFLNEQGEWQAVQHLVEPVIEKAKRAWQAQDAANQQANRPVRRSTPRWVWVGAGVTLAVVCSAPILRGLYLHRRTAMAEEAGAMWREKAARMEDFIAGKQVVPGMKPEHVLRALGQPKRTILIGAAHREEWLYGSRVVVFEGELVTEWRNPRRRIEAGEAIFLPADNTE